MSKGIYALEINGRYYIGKDTVIHNQKRIRDHLLLLNKGEHYNTHLQRAYIKYNKEITWFIVEEHADISNVELSILERKIIKQFDSFTNGYNMTLGGEGMYGYTWSEEQKKKGSERIQGEKNPNAKITKEEFLDIVELLITGKSNRFIGELFDLNDRYVSLIRHKRRYRHLWQHIEYDAVKSNDVAELLGNVSEQEFQIIIEKMLEGYTNREIEDEHELPGGTASRIRNKKLYLSWWEKHYPDYDEVIKRIAEVHSKKISEIQILSGQKAKGIKRSPATKETMRKTNGKSKAVMIDGKEYSSMMHAEEVIGINRKVIAKRVLSDVYPNYTRVIKAPDITCQPLQPNDRKSKAIRIDGIVYESMSQASRELGIDRKTIAGRVMSPSFENYELFDE
ncbi:NUMOD1 domain-containing DNA-binding protein [Neobacillus mesonae]|uniref:GIY-YIG domain-containing protein n=1 Tax=Neobacillus mesonae TaxID=1193713 RepID=A0A3T0HZ94_9BACI|nr:NUMOD1 domain-containing DNA-binding protein [Neobacillus mesonae]AZU62480.1 hypothetical protein CHR53_15000 [Neobacillus mesonae]